MQSDFTFRFNRNKQWVCVFLHDVHPTTFASWGAGRWAYFQASPTPKYGLFGELHFVKSRLRMDTIVHELYHVHAEWMWSHGETLTRKNEERMAKFMDEITRKFLRELKKVEPRIKL